MAIWGDEKLFFKTTDFFESFITDCKKAKKSIFIEVFVFEKGKLLDSIIPTLAEAANRGIDVRIIMDGLFSHNIPSDIFPRYPKIKFAIFHPFFPNIFRINQRNHRKLFLIDDRIGYVGSSNIHDSSLDWRETGVRLVGSNVKALSKAFDRSWIKTNSKSSLLSIMTAKVEKLFFSSFRQMMMKKIIMTEGSFGRLVVKEFWIKKIQRSHTRIWISSPYFIPTPSLFKSLKRAAKKGVDIRIIVPMKDKSDMPFTKNIERYYVQKLLEQGVKVYEYQPQFIHAKVNIFDNEVILGSSNWNYRSRLLDLELDVILGKAESVVTIEKKFKEDLINSRTIDISEFHEPRLLKKIYYNLIFLIRFWS